MVRLCIALLAALALAGTARAEHLDSEEHALWTLINDYRQTRGVQPLGLNPQLMAAAEWMSEDMAANDYCSHTDSLGRYSFQRMNDFGYSYEQADGWRGENIVCGAEAGQAVFEQMEASPEHNANILSPPYRKVGIARAYGEARGWCWTIDLAGQSPAVPPAEPTSTPMPEPTAIPTPIPPLTKAGGPVPAQLPDTGTRP